MGLLEKGACAARGSRDGPFAQGILMLQTPGVGLQMDREWMCSLRPHEQHTSGGRAQRWDSGSEPLKLRTRYKRAFVCF